MKLTPFGKEVRKIRIDRGHLLKDMADALAVSSAFLSAVETGKKPVPVDFVDRLAKLYNLDRAATSRLNTALATSRNEFPIALCTNASVQHREVAAVLARRFPGLRSDSVQRIMATLEEDEDA